MDKNSIGVNAGIIWQLMYSENRSWSMEELKIRTRLSDKELAASIGWLARENKIEFETNTQEEKLYLTTNFYF